MSGIFVLQNVATGKCLDSNSAGNGYALGWNSGNYQKWNVVQHGAYAKLYNVATGRVLDSNNAGNVYFA
jgi:serine/threonine-protein kinase